LHDLQELLAKALRNRQVRIYEAGSGSASVLPLASLNRGSIVVVDIDETQLSNNHYADCKILGDIQTHEFLRQAGFWRLNTLYERANF
jgi:hypothetical protein